METNAQLFKFIKKITESHPYIKLIHWYVNYVSELCFKNITTGHLGGSVG